MQISCLKLQISVNQPKIEINRESDGKMEILWVKETKHIAANSQWIKIIAT
jgi:hypothetical protein